MIQPTRTVPVETRGFTLVETLVAITILIVVIVGPLYAVHKAVAASYVARDKIIAAALAQEGVEYVRSVRDNNYLSNSGRSWLAGVDGTSNGTNSANCFTNSCTVDQSQQSILACAGSGCNALRISPANIYTQSLSGAYPLTKFTRSVQLATVPSGASISTATEVTVTVTVSWVTLRTLYSVTVTEHLYNWL